MKRTLMVLGWMFFGAIATASGAGLFLWQANHDRNLLSQALSQCQAITQNDSDSRISLAYEARIQSIENELKQARQDAQRLHQEEQLRAQATNLPKPTLARLRGWHDVASVGLGLSMRLPPSAMFRIADDVVTGQVSTRTPQGRIEEQWLYASAFNEQRRQDVEQRMASPLEVGYTTQNILLTGSRGTLPDGRRLYLLTIRQQGTPSHLLWLMPAGNISEAMLLEVLSTISLSPRI